MKKLLILLVLISLISCRNNSMQEAIIGKPKMDIGNKKLTPEILWSFGRIGEVSLSPDNSKVVYNVKYYDIAQNKGNADIYLMAGDGSGVKQITRTAASEFNIVWRPDGKKIGFIYADDDGNQIWEMNPDGTERIKISNIKGGITGFKYAPDGKKIVYAKEVSLEQNITDKYPDLKKANAYIEEDLMFRHWDHWTETFSHLFIANYNGGKLSGDKDIMKDEKFNSPNKPFGGMEQIAWSPDSKSIVYTCVKKYGKAYAISTNSNLYSYNLENHKTQLLTEGMMGYDKNPVFSPNGKFLAWESMERDGYEADQIRLIVLDLEEGTSKDYTSEFDQDVHSLAWGAGSEELFFISDWHARFQVYRLDLNAGSIEALTKGDHNYQSILVGNGQLIATKMSMSMPTEIFTIGLENKVERQISTVNNTLLSQLEMGEVEERWIETTDGKKMLTWVIYPPNFDPNKKYPALLYCQGGPQSAVSQFFSYRWNFQIMAANDYIIVAPNRRGLPSFGMAWNEQISKDWPGQNIQDYLSAIDEVSKEPYVDETKLGAVGASYGGFSVFWLAGNHDKRFKTFIAHDGAFNLESMYLETEELWFVNWEFGGPYWDRQNAPAQRTYNNSPHRFVDKWDTPIMVIHGEKDYRITYNQGMQAFTAAKLRGIPARYLHFPDENHWVLSPQNGILWQREFFDWLDKWLK